MNCFDPSNLVSQTSQLESITPINIGLALYPINGLQDPLNTEPIMHSSSADPASSSLLDSGSSPTPIVFTVTSTTDTEDANDGVMTLREVIAATNASG